MVKKDPPAYLFLGPGSPEKEAKLKSLKAEFLIPETREFNLDILSGRESLLRSLQEAFLYLPLKTGKRILLIKEAQGLKEEARAFILDYLRDPRPGLALILDLDQPQAEGDFIRRLSRYCQVFVFRKPSTPDTFTLSRQIELKKVDSALKILGQLLYDGERPERILGGLRYAWERDMLNSLQLGKRMRLLLNCDNQIKTGRAKPEFALEKLIVRLCCFG